MDWTTGARRTLGATTGDNSSTYKHIRTHVKASMSLFQSTRVGKRCGPPHTKQTQINTQTPTRTHTHIHPNAGVYLQETYDIFMYEGVQAREIFANEWADIHTCAYRHTDQDEWLRTILLRDVIAELVKLRR